MENQTTIKKDASKDALVASLVELSKVAVKTAERAIDFANAYGGDVDGSSISAISESLNLILKSGKREGDVLEKEDGATKKKKKVERDPNAPKKPLTMFFAFSYTLRKKIGEDRKKKGESSLSAIETNQTIKEAWDKLSDAEKAKWKKKYDDEMITYREEFKKYEDSLKNGTEYHAPHNQIQSSPLDAPKIEKIADAVDEDDDEEEEEEEEEVVAPVIPAPEEKKKKKKSEKKEKKKKSSSQQSN